MQERLQYALVKGIGDFLEEDLAEALPLYDKAVDVIEGPLMEGMNHVGEGGCSASGCSSCSHNCHEEE